MIKKYLKLSLVLSVSLFCLSAPVVSAERIECADGTFREVSESDTAHNNVANLCNGHGGVKPGTDLQPSPRCYSHDGTRNTTCDYSIGTKFESGKCYTEKRGGPNGVLLEYFETSCAKPTSLTPDGSTTPATAVDCTTQPNNNADFICTPTAKNKCVGKDAGKDAKACDLFGYINDAIKLLSAMIGIVVTIMIIAGGIMYSSAGGDPNKVQKAKSLIFKGVFALVGYGLLFAVLNWLVPGGILLN